MAESITTTQVTQPCKRSRNEEEETQQTQETLREENSNNAKRHKSYNDILSILEDEETGLGPDPAETGSDLFTTLQQELGFLPSHEEFESDPVDIGSGQSTGSDILGSSTTSSFKDELEDDRSSVIRHLLEASDDELGIPSGDGINGGDLIVDEDNGINGGDFPFALSDGLWEFEDEAANYYSLLQSELFM